MSKPTSKPAATAVATSGTPGPMPGRQVAERGFSIIVDFGQRYGVEPGRVLGLLRGTAFKVKASDPPVTDDELIQLLVVSRVYNLNPFTKEIYAFRAKSGGIVPIIGIDGWIKIVEAQPTYCGEEMAYGYDETLGPDKQPLGFFCEVRLHRSDRNFPISRRQYHKENVRDTDPWKTMPTRMLGHRAFIQSARAAFGLGGIYDEDEGEVIAISGGVEVLRRAEPARATEPESRAGAEEPFATDAQVLAIREKLAKTGVPDNLVLAKFELGDFDKLRSNQVPEVLKFIEDNAP